MRQVSLLMGLFCGRVGAFIAPMRNVRAMSLARMPLANSFQDVNSNRKADAMNGVASNAPVVILVRTFLDQNVGAVARAMLNFGLCDLRLVDPQCDHLSDAARARASGSQVPVLERAEVFPTVAAASADLRATFATTARMRDMTMPVMTPQDLARSVAELSIETASELTSDAAGSLGSDGTTATTTEETATNMVPMRCGLIFGPEQSGLTNADVAGCDALVQIATNPNFASLNLAQAVNLVAYECYKETLARSSKGSGTVEEAVGDSSSGSAEASNESLLGTSSEVPLMTPAAATLRCRDGDRPATKGEVFGLLDRLTSALDDAGYKKGPQEGPKGNSPRSAADEKLVALAGRAALTSGEVSLLHGILSALSEVKQARAAAVPADRRLD